MELLLLFGLIGAFSFLDLSSGNSAADDREEDGPDPSQPVQSGSNSDDNLLGDASAQTLNGFTGDDTLEALGGDDSLFGGKGQDLLVGGRGADVFYGGDGDDQIREDWYLVSNPSELDDGNDTAYGGAGQDFIRGLAGDDSLLGGVGHDALFGDEGDDSLYGGSGHDSLYGGEGADLLEGGFGDDHLFGDGGMDTLFGGSGDDRLDTRAPGFRTAPDTAVLFGGEGDDQLQFLDGSTVSGGAGADLFFMGDSLSDTLVSRIEDFDPDEDSLTIYLEVANGDGGGFALVARPDGLGRDLYLGDDLVAEILSAKPFTLQDMSFVVNLDNTPGGVTTYTVGPQDASLNITYVDSAGDDRIIGNSGADRLFSYGASDLLEGGGGNDTLFGLGSRIDSFGADDEPLQNIVILETDTLLGGAGDDDLWAWDGGVMTGGAGSDVFLTRLNYADPAIQVQIPLALITDFDPAEDVVVVGPLAGVFPTPADIQVQALADGTGADVLVRGIAVARVIGGQSLTPADIRIENIDQVSDYRAA